MIKKIIVDRERSIIILDGKLYYDDRKYEVGDIDRREYICNSCPYICYNVQKLATTESGEYAVYRADLCEIHGSGEMSRYFTKEAHKC